MYMNDYVDLFYKYMSTYEGLDEDDIALLPVTSLVEYEHSFEEWLEEQWEKLTFQGEPERGENHEIHD